MDADDRITIIDGPPPTFEDIDQGWAAGLNEGPYLYDTAITRLRTHNGSALVERCHRAWSSSGMMHLHYRNTMGLEETAPIVAARTTETPDGDMLMLWVRLAPTLPDTETESGEDDDEANIQ